MSDSLATLRGRIGAYALHSQRDPRETTRAARRAFLGKFEVAVDPDGVLPPAERARRAEAAKKLHFTRLALRSLKTRRRKKSGRPAGGGADDRCSTGGRSDAEHSSTP